jgi:anti-sigma B factor antagonist
MNSGTCWPNTARSPASVAPVNETNPRLQITLDGSCLVLEGEVDAHTAPALAERLDPLPPGDADVALDMKAVEFIDSSGLRVLVDAHHRAEQHQRRLILRSPSAAVSRLLEISGLSDHLVVTTD